ncbi:MAG: glycine cleavage system aminomethyltransferase GcvT, partial [Planctomycetota bacterium]
QMVDFAGWEMPIRYTSIVEEHRQVRTKGGVFDVSHMARLRIKGRHARRLLERACTRKIYDMAEKQCRYALMCNETGGVIDDVLVYRLDETEFLVVANASNRAKVIAQFEAIKASGELVCTIDDQTESTAMVAVQGPGVIEEIGRFSSEIPTLKKYRFTQKNLMIMKVLVSRTGYTGEDGVEAILPAKAISMAMQLMFKDVDLKADDAPIKLAGLGARDTLRMEAGMPLYGHELGEDINALASGLGFAISLDKSDDDRGEHFVGQDALRKTRDEGGPARVLAGLKLEGRRAARQGATVKIGGAESGEVTSGCLSPTFDYPIAMAYVDREKAEAGTAVEVDTGRATIGGEIVPLPFYKR